jgi:hypothetical protein
MTNFFIDSKFNGDISRWNVSNVEHMRNIFFGAKFNGDLSGWKPYSVKYPRSIFVNSLAKKPYWINYEDKEARRKAIDSYCLEKELEKELNRNNIQEKKIKI